VLLSSNVTTMCIIRHNRHLNRFANKNYGKIWPPPFAISIHKCSPIHLQQTQNHFILRQYQITYTWHLRCCFLTVAILYTLYAITGWATHLREESDL
jgi:hypothetical protein